MRTQRQANPLGKLLGGASIIAISIVMARALGAPHDPVSAVSSSFLFLCGLWVVTSGLLDLIRKLMGVWRGAKLRNPQAFTVKPLLPVCKTVPMQG